MSVLIEACVDSVESALAAVQGGANRLELCENLAVGGTTPSQTLLRAVKQRVEIPVFTMIRPRGGAFEYSDAELARMRTDIELMRAGGADGVVLGILDGDRVDGSGTRELVALAGNAPVTFHRAFDLVVDKMRGLGELLDAGVSRVLTSGGPAAAEDGIADLARLVDRAGPRLTILAGGGVRAHNVREIVRRTGVREVHLRCELDPARIAAVVEALSGSSDYSRG